MRVETATSDDIDWIVRHRLGMFKDMGWPDSELHETEIVLRNWLAHRWEQSPVYYLVYQDGDVIGGCAVSSSTMLPSSKLTTGLSGYIHNMYVEPEWRKRGAAGFLVRQVIEDAKAQQTGKLTLRATEMSRKLYQSLGFVWTDNCYSYDVPQKSSKSCSVSGRSWLVI